jgi:formate-dependent nitrite reductase cytochrome c552 subunit
MDKLDKYPFLALPYNGWGFGIEYREPRGHHYRSSINWKSIHRASRPAAAVSPVNHPVHHSRRRNWAKTIGV